MPPEGPASCDEGSSEGVEPADADPSDGVVAGTASSACDGVVSGTAPSACDGVEDSPPHPLATSTDTARTAQHQRRGRPMLRIPKREDLRLTLADRIGWEATVQGPLHLRAGRRACPRFNHPNRAIRGRPVRCEGTSENFSDHRSSVLEAWPSSGSDTERVTSAALLGLRPWLSLLSEPMEAARRTSASSSA